MNLPDDWWWPCYSADEVEADVKEKAAKKLGVPEEQVEVLETRGAWLARERREDE